MLLIGWKSPCRSCRSSKSKSDGRNEFSVLSALSFGEKSLKTVCFDLYILKLLLDGRSASV
jgi:hypothetical protein